MKKQVGIWIDHREAIIAVSGGEAVKSEHMQSGVERHIRIAGHSASHAHSADDQKDRQFATHLARYYDEVIAHVRDADSILLFGPSEAKGELQKRFVNNGLGGRVAAVETADKMTDHQISAKVRQYFHEPKQTAKAD